MTCICPYVHRTSSLSSAGLLIVTNSTNVGNFDPFCLIMTINPDGIITGAPQPVTISINGNDVPVVDIWGLPITTDVLGVCRTKYKGRYVENDTPHITLTGVLSNEAKGV